MRKPNLVIFLTLLISSLACQKKEVYEAAPPGLSENFVESGEMDIKIETADPMQVTLNDSFILQEKENAKVMLAAAQKEPTKFANLVTQCRWQDKVKSQNFKLAKAKKTKFYQVIPKEFLKPSEDKSFSCHFEFRFLYQKQLMKKALGPIIFHLKSLSGNLHMSLGLDRFDITVPITYEQATGIKLPFDIKDFRAHLLCEDLEYSQSYTKSNEFNLSNLLYAAYTGEQKQKTSLQSCILYLETQKENLVSDTFLISLPVKPVEINVEHNLATIKNLRQGEIPLMTVSIFNPNPKSVMIWVPALPAEVTFQVVYSATPGLNEVETTNVYSRPLNWSWLGTPLQKNSFGDYVEIKSNNTVKFIATMEAKLPCMFGLESMTLGFNLSLSPKNLILTQSHFSKEPSPKYIQHNLVFDPLGGLPVSVWGGFNNWLPSNKKDHKNRPQWRIVNNEPRTC